MCVGEGAAVPSSKSRGQLGCLGWVLLEIATLGNLPEGLLPLRSCMLLPTIAAVSQLTGAEIPKIAAQLHQYPFVSKIHTLVAILKKRQEHEKTSDSKFQIGSERM